MSKSREFKEYMGLLIGYVIGNIICIFMHSSWETAIERSFFQIIAIVGVWLVLDKMPGWFDKLEEMARSREDIQKRKAEINKILGD